MKLKHLSIFIALAFLCQAVQAQENVYEYIYFMSVGADTPTVTKRMENGARIYFTDSEIQWIDSTGTTSISYQDGSMIKFGAQNNSVDQVTINQPDALTLVYNPSTKTLEVVGNAANSNITVYNPSGALLASSIGSKLNIDHLSSGIYIAVASANGQQCAIKFQTR